MDVLRCWLRGARAHGSNAVASRSRQARGTWIRVLRGHNECARKRGKARSIHTRRSLQRGRRLYWVADRFRDDAEESRAATVIPDLYGAYNGAGGLQKGARAS